MNSTLQTLLQRPDLWRAKSGLAVARPTMPSGLPALDRALGGGWPAGALIELLLERSGIGELRLLVPLLSGLSKQGVTAKTSAPPRRQVWIDPPLPLYAPALRQHGIGLEELLIVRPVDRAQWLWSCIQALRAGPDIAVLCWPNRHRLRYAELRQLQVAASDHGSLGFLLRDLAQGRGVLQHSTPSPLRLQLTGTVAALCIDILKQRGSASGQRILAPHAAALQPPPRRRPRSNGATRRRQAPHTAPMIFPEVRV